MTNGVSVTLTTANTRYNLYTLLKAIDPSIVPWCHSVSIQSDVTANAGIALGIGDKNVQVAATQRVGDAEGAGGDGYFDSSLFNGVQLDGIFVIADTNTAVLNIGISVQ